MELLPSILTTEADRGPAESIAVPAEYVDALVAEMDAAGRLDLVPLVTAGDPGVMIVTIAGRDWPFGGL